MSDVIESHEEQHSVFYTVFDLSEATDLPDGLEPGLYFSIDAPEDQDGDLAEEAGKSFAAAPGAVALAGPYATLEDLQAAVAAFIEDALGDEVDILDIDDEEVELVDEDDLKEAELP